jgi:hypothetical protein
MKELGVPVTPDAMGEQLAGRICQLLGYTLELTQEASVAG